MDYFNTYRHSCKYYGAYGLKCSNREFLQYHKHYTVNGHLNIYTLDSKFHHDSKPAICEYIDEHILIGESYYKNGKRHNNRGPAVIYNDHNGNMLQSSYYLDDCITNIIDHSVTLYNN